MIYHTLCAAIRSGQLDWSILTDCPSQLVNGHLYLSHERVTALLAEQHLAHADIDRHDFNAIMRSLGGKCLTIASEQSIDTNGNGEIRSIYRVSLDRLMVEVAA